MYDVCEIWCVGQEGHRQLRRARHLRPFVRICPCDRQGQLSTHAIKWFAGVSGLGPVLFTLDTSPLEDLIASHGFDAMLFADDSQIYVVCKRPDDVKSSLEECVDDIKRWMESNMLILNDDKTEVVHFVSKNKTLVTELDNLRVGMADIQPSSVVRNLGVMFRSDGDMKVHINKMCSAAFFALHRIGKIRSLLDHESCEKLIHAFVTSRLDYCNSLFLNTLVGYYKKLQSVQNAAARLLVRRSKYDHITPILRELHWLPVCKRVEFKVALMCFKIMSGDCPEYLRTIIRPNRNGIRADETNELTRVDNRKTSVSYGDCAFSIGAPILWNSLPPFIRTETNFSKFKTLLKTHLFKQYFY